MFFNQRSDSLEIARQIIANTGLDENLGILKQKKHKGAVPPQEHLKLVMALSTCNLVQTMKAEFMAGAFTPEKAEALVKDYVLESLKKQDLLRLGAKEAEALRLEVMEVVAELQGFWNEEEDPQGSGPGPRYYCVKEILKRLGGGEPDHNLHDALFELMYLQHKHYLKFFRAHLEKPEEPL